MDDGKFSDRQRKTVRLCKGDRYALRHTGREGFDKDRYLAYQEYLDAHNGIVDEETAFRLLHENHIPGDEKYSVIFNLTKRTAALQFASDFAVMYRYQL